MPMIATILVCAMLLLSVIAIGGALLLMCSTVTIERVH